MKRYLIVILLFSMLSVYAEVPECIIKDLNKRHPGSSATDLIPLMIQENIDYLMQGCLEGHPEFNIEYYSFRTKEMHQVVYLNYMNGDEDTLHGFEFGIDGNVIDNWFQSSKRFTYEITRVSEVTESNEIAIDWNESFSPEEKKKVIKDIMSSVKLLDSIEDPDIIGARAVIDESELLLYRVLGYRFKAGIINAMKKSIGEESYTDRLKSIRESLVVIHSQML